MNAARGPTRLTCNPGPIGVGCELEDERAPRLNALDRLILEQVQRIPVEASPDRLEKSAAGQDETRVRWALRP
jgi:hypothetical protein